MSAKQQVIDAVMTYLGGAPTLDGLLVVRQLVTHSLNEMTSILEREAATIARYDEALASKDAEIARLREALGSLVAVVGNMRVPQTPEEAGVQIMLTIGPSLERARQALEEGKAP